MKAETKKLLVAIGLVIVHPGMFGLGVGALIAEDAESTELQVPPAPPPAPTPVPPAPTPTPTPKPPPPVGGDGGR